MKKLIAITLVFAMCFSLFGCKEADEDTAKPLDISQNEAENQTENQNENPQPEPEQNKQPETQKEPQKEKGDKAEPCALTVDNSFSPYEVVVTLTLEESKKNKTYTEKDFEYADIYYLYQKDNYFNTKYEPQYKDRVTLFLYINEPSKQNVLDTVKLIEKDERVYSACPCAINATEGIVEISLYNAKHYDLEETDWQQDRIEGFFKEKIEKMNNVLSCSSKDYRLEVELSNKSMKSTIDFVKQIKNGFEVRNVQPQYRKVNTNYIALITDSSKHFSKADFPYLELKYIDGSSFGNGKTELRLYPKDKSLQYHVDAVAKLSSDDRFISCYLNYEQYGEVL